MTGTERRAVRTRTRQNALLGTIDRPKARNAVHTAVAEGIAEAVRRLDEYPLVRFEIVRMNEVTSFDPCTGAHRSGFH